MCGVEFEVPEYYIRLHGDRPFHNTECFKRYRTYKGLIDAAKKNPNNKMLLNADTLLKF